MQIIPTTTKGLSIYVLLTFLLVFVMFTQQYGWYNWNKFLKKGQQA
jgi:hypothetical protein